MGEGIVESRKHQVSLSERELLMMNGVTNVNRFDDTEISLDTTKGKMIIEGKELHISRLSVSSGEIMVEGNISAVIYEEERVRKGFLSRIGK